MKISGSRKVPFGTNQQVKYSSYIHLDVLFCPTVSHGKRKREKISTRRGNRITDDAKKGRRDVGV